jgi:hypothetical protein
MKICHSLVIIFFVIMSFATLAQEEVPDTTVYNCDVPETINFIEQSSTAFYSPSAVPTTAEMKDAYIQAKQEQGGDACLSILTDSTFSDEWKSLVDTVRNADFSIPSFDPELGALYEVLKRTIEEQVTGALDDLGEDICKFMSSENLEKLALGAIARETGVRSRELTIDAFANEIGDLVYDSSDDNVQRLLSKDKMKRDVRAETRRELREIRKDLWDNL